jgi:hypothetical protein
MKDLSPLTSPGALLDSCVSPITACILRQAGRLPNPSGRKREIGAVHCSSAQKFGERSHADKAKAYNAYDRPHDDLRESWRAPGGGELVRSGHWDLEMGRLPRSSITRAESRDLRRGAIGIPRACDCSARLTPSKAAITLVCRCPITSDVALYRDRRRYQPIAFGRPSPMVPCEKHDRDHRSVQFRSQQPVHELAAGATSAPTIS